MATYLLLNVVFMALTLAALRRYLPTVSRPLIVTLLCLVVLTAVFDNVIISLGIVAYNTQTLLGIYLYKAPVEDFFYALLAVAIVPGLWNYFKSNKESQK